MFFDLLKGVFKSVYDNEVALDTKSDYHDPVKYRGGSWFKDAWKVIVSGDYLRGDSRDERGFFGIRHNDDLPKDVVGDEYALYLTDPGVEASEPTQKLRLRVTHDAVWFYRYAADGGVSTVRLDVHASIVQSFLRSPNGVFDAEMQEDGNVVVYREQPAREVMFSFFGMLDEVAALKARILTLEARR